MAKLPPTFAIDKPAIRKRPLRLVSREVQGNRLSPQKLRLLAERLANSKNRSEASQTREAIARGFYGI
jgi:hypothetical protein